MRLDAQSSKDRIPELRHTDANRILYVTWMRPVTAI
jgi:hypothetical protein